MHGLWRRAGAQDRSIGGDLAQGRARYGLESLRNGFLARQLDGLAAPRRFRWTRGKRLSARRLAVIGKVERRDAAELARQGEQRLRRPRLQLKFDLADRLGSSASHNLALVQRQFDLGSVEQELSLAANNPHIEGGFQTRAPGNQLGQRPKSRVRRQTLDGVLMLLAGDTLPALDRLNPSPLGFADPQ